MRPVVFALLVASAILSACNPANQGGPGAASSPGGGDANAVVREKFVETPKGTEVELGNYAFWNGECKARAFRLEVIEQPANGTVRLERAIITVYNNPSFGESGPCVGQIIESKKLHYKPADGFAGTDRFKVRARLEENIAIDNFEVEVY